MYRKLTSATVLALFIVFAAAFTTNTVNDDDATSWELDKSHSAINFTVNHFFTPVDGTFEDYTADIKFDPANLENSSISVEIQVASVNTRNDRRDDHIKTGDFFNAEAYPSIKFTSNRITNEGNNNFVAHGQITIRDVTKEFSLPFELLGMMDHPMRENSKVAGIVASAEIMRNDFGVGTGDWRATAVVGNKVNIQLNLELLSTN
jgi:polyisoprenoid-binding protein YceI